MATDPNKPWLQEGFSLSYNPFTANEVARDVYGRSGFYKDKTGQWMQAVERQKQGDMDFGPTSYDYVPYEGDPSDARYSVASGDTGSTELGYEKGWEQGVNWDEIEKNNPEIAANWGVRDSGSVFRDSMGYTQFKVVSHDPESGSYITMSKTGDKEGTLQLWMPTEDGGMKVVKNLGTQEWDTNKNVTEQGAFQVAKVLAAPLAVAAGQAYGLIPQGSMGSLVGEAAAGGSGIVGNSVALGGSGGGSVIESILGQSVLPGSAASPTSGAIFGPGGTFGNAMSIASPGAFSGALPLTAGEFGSGLVSASSLVPTSNPLGDWSTAPDAPGGPEPFENNFPTPDGGPPGVPPDAPPGGPPKAPPGAPPSGPEPFESNFPPTDGQGSPPVGNKTMTWDDVLDWGKNLFTSKDFLGGVLKIGAGLWADSNNQESYNNYLNRVDTWRKEDRGWAVEDRDLKQKWDTEDREDKQAFEEKLTKDRWAEEERVRQDAINRRNANQAVGNVNIGGMKWNMKPGIVGNRISLGG